MARALALVPDLLFGSRLQGAMEASGQQLELLQDEARLRTRLGDGEGPPADVIVVDLTDADLDGAGILESLRRDGQLEGLASIGFYSHVDAAARERAERAGFDLVVPRSRMAREGPALVAGLT